MSQQVPMKLFSMLGIVALCTQPVDAAPIVITDPGASQNVVAIHGLSVSGTEYDVTFTHDSFDNVFGASGPAPSPSLTTVPTFLDDAAGATAAANAIVATLVGQGFGLSTLDDGPRRQFSVVHSFNSGFAGFGAIGHGGLGEPAGTPWFSQSIGFNRVDTFNVVQVQFVGSAATVPEPTSLALLATGAIGLIGYRKRKRKLVA